MVEGAILVYLTSRGSRGTHEGTGTSLPTDPMITVSPGEEQNQVVEGLSLLEPPGIVGAPTP